jgi:hypothetical protein
VQLTLIPQHLLRAGDDAELLDQCDLMVVKGSDDVIAINDKYILKPLLTPTPRWPDLMCLLDPQSKLLFTSKLFSAHVAPGLINEKVRQRQHGPRGWVGKFACMPECCSPPDQALQDAHDALSPDLESSQQPPSAAAYVHQHTKP